MDVQKMIKLDNVKALFSKVTYNSKYFEVYNELSRIVKDCPKDTALIEIEAYINMSIRNNDVIGVIAAYDLYKNVKG